MCLVGAAASAPLTAFTRMRGRLGVAAIDACLFGCGRLGFHERISRWLFLGAGNRFGNVAEHHLRSIEDAKLQPY